MYASVELLEFRLGCVEGTGSRDAMDDNLVPDFILPKTGCCRYVGSDGFINGKAVDFEDRDHSCICIVFGDKHDGAVGCELYGGNERLDNCRVDSIAYSKVIGIVWKCCAISLNDNRAVALVKTEVGACLF